MNPDQSLISLFLNASALVKMVMLLLLSVSIISWTLIMQRWQIFRQSLRSATEFENTFWLGGIDLNKLYQRFSSSRSEASGTQCIFLAGFKEFTRLRKQSVLAPAIMEGAQRAMRVAMGREIERLEAHLPFLATVGSVSPYVGLFGTVWGIMNSFRALGSVQQATLAMVAPGIAEALVATAMGLFAAIPAVIAYNRYSSRLQVMTNQYATFLEEFTSILHRQAHNPVVQQPEPQQSGSEI
jgi:biopolymer transport protein TolQ